jgi:hypothetical protein
MRALLCLATLASLATLAADLPKWESVKALGYDWDVPAAADWHAQPNLLEMLKIGPAKPEPRRPMQYALARTSAFRNVTLEVDVKRTAGKSLILLYAWQDPAHFNYAHLSVDRADQQIVHNGIFHVYGGERVRISAKTGPATLPTGEWTRVKLIVKGAQAWMEFDGKTNPSLEAHDLSLTEGRIGLGSFFERAAFRNLRIKAE